MSIFLKNLHHKWGNYYYVLITTSAAIITGFINYMYHPMMIRYLTSSDFGVFQSLMSMFNIFSVVSAGIGMYLTQQFSKSGDDYTQLSVLKYVRSKFAKWWGISIFIFFVCLSPLLTIYLHLPSFRLVVLVAISYLFTGYGMVFICLLKGTQKFESISVLLIIGAVSRVSFGAIAIWLDFGVAGAITAVSLGSILSVFLEYLYTRKIAAISTDTTKSLPQQKIKKHIRPIAFFTVVSVITMLLSQIDIFVVQHTFYGDEAGIYVAVSILAKFIFFLAGSVETVYYTQFTKTLLHDVSRKQIRNYFILLSAVILGGYVGSWFLGEYVLYLFKPTLAPYAGRLQWLLIGSGAIFMYTTILKLLVARKQNIGAYILIGIGGVIMILLHILPESLVSFVHLYTLCMVSLAIVGLCIFRYIIHTNKKLSLHDI